MAELRLIGHLLSLVALVACAPAAADPPAVASGLAAPAGWQALPELATAVSAAAKADDIVVEGSEAWGEPARGCYASWIALRGGEATLLAIDDLLASLAAEKFVASDIVKPPGDGVLALTFSRAAFTGKLRARLDRGRIVALACFANGREPASCAAPCATLLGTIS